MRVGIYTLKSQKVIATKSKSKVTRITITCERGRIYEDQVGKRGKDRKCTGTIKSSKAIVPEHRCSMYFNTYEQEDGRICVRKNGVCNCGNTKITQRHRRQ